MYPEIYLCVGCILLCCGIYCMCEPCVEKVCFNKKKKVIPLTKKEVKPLTIV